MNHPAPCRNWKSLGLLLALFICGAGSLSAQDCEAIVLPKLNNDANRLAQYPAEKIAYHCAFSQLSFEMSDTLPAGAVMYEISEVKDVFTKIPMDKNVQIDLNVLSYYRYDFNRFQGMHPYQTLYFHTPSSSHPYLVLVPMTVAQQRAVDRMNQQGF